MYLPTIEIATEVRRPSISLVVPNRNHGRYLRRSLRALIGQTRPADEIIIIDDDSTDDSVEIIEEVTTSASNVRVIRNACCRGVIENLNRGLDEASGEYIAFPAADDLLFLSFLEETSGLLGCYPAAGFATSRAEIWDGQDRVVGHAPLFRPATRAGYVSADRFRRLLHWGDDFFSPGVLYRRDVLLELDKFDPELGPMSDAIVLKRIAGRRGFCFSPKTLSMWRMHGENYSLTTLVSEKEFDRMSGRVSEVLRAEPDGVFFSSYRERLDRRNRYVTARLLLLRDDLMNESAQSRLAKLAGGPVLDKAVLAFAARWGGLARKAVLAWLFFRLRPFSLLWFTLELIRRRFD